MQDYIKRIKRLGGNDAVNGETLNTVVQQLQHNIDLLYNSQNSTRQDKNLAELLFGNVLDYDQTGNKRFVNGGKMDTVEKIYSFDPSSGNINLEETDLYDGKSFLTWSLSSGLLNNVEITRNVKVPEALYGQKMLVGFKVMGFESGSIKSGERFDIYVNNVYSGSGNTGLTSKDGDQVFKTIYGVYDLGAEETNLEVTLKRSSTNINTPTDYVIRVQNVFVGLHTLSNTSYELNFPSDIGPLKGVVPDINFFYNFDNVSVNPIPSFLFTSIIESVSGYTTPYTINITSGAQQLQSTYYVAYTGTGDETGVDASNKISYTDFFSKIKNVTHMTVNVESSDSYENFIFDDGNTYELIFDGDISIFGGGFVVSNSSQVNIKTDDEFYCNEFSITDSNVRFETNGVETNKFTTDDFVVDNGNAVFETAIFSMPLIGGKFEVKNNSNVDISIFNTAFTNSSAQNGFGLSTAPISVTNHSNASVVNNNSNLTAHIGYGDGVDNSIYVDKNSSLSVENISLSTSATDKSIIAKKQSSIELETIQKDGGSTAFTDYDLSVYSSFSTTGISGISGTTVQSYVYEFE